MVGAWRDTWLWQRLDALPEVEDAAVAAVLETVMPSVELVVGEQVVKDFTLHDAGHAQRVAGLMIEVMSEETAGRLSAYELALLLASAYLHDIGMSPAHELVAAHHALLVRGDAGDLSADDLRLFQQWLDREHEGIEPPLDEDAHTDVLLGQYIRARHVDWGERWIRDEIAARLEVPGYEEFVADLIQLCRSHHQGYGELTAVDFSPRFLRRGKATVHRRYLACVLRVADVLDVDPERTPEVLLAHRDVAPESAVYWHKDHEMKLSIEPDGRVVVEAEPSSAILYRAVEETIEGIEAELRLCRDVDAAHPFEIAPRRPGRTLPHRWRLEPIAYCEIHPRDDSFVYVDGAFRPDTERLLELLGGRELYGDPLMALRELLQNSFDAVRERIAWQRLVHPQPAEPETAAALADGQRVEVSLERRGNGETWLRCADSGAGMTRETIVNHLLVSGAGRHPELPALARRAREAGFELERTGMFGIGVLSYFMLADRLELRTRRCAEAPSAEPGGWAFGTDGVGSFGELTEEPEWRQGTEVSLRLIEPPEAESLVTALRSLVLRAPCEIVFSVDGAEQLRLPAGWVEGLDGLVESTRKGLEETIERARSNEDEFRPEADREEDAQRLRAFEEALGSLVASIRWLVAEGEFPEGLGSYRLAMPYVETEIGPALALLNLGKDEEGWYLSGIGLGRIVRFDFPVSQSVGGMRISEHVERHAPRRAHPWITNVDWRAPAAGRVLASRDEIELSPPARRALDKLPELLEDSVVELLEAAAPSPLTRLNARLAEAARIVKVPGLESPWWLRWQPAGEDRWMPRLEELQLPVVAGRDLTPGLRVGGRPVTVPGHISTGFADSFGDWEAHRQPPQRFVRDLDRQDLVGYWPDLSLRERGAMDFFPEFPPGAEHVAGIAMWGKGFAWNLSSPICSGTWARERTRGRRKDPSPAEPAVREQALRGPTTARRWLFDLVSGYERHGGFPFDAKALWEDLAEDEPDFAHRIFELALGTGDDSRILLIDQSYGGVKPQTVTFSPEGLEATEEDDLGEEIQKLWSADGWSIERVEDG